MFIEKMSSKELLYEYQADFSELQTLTSRYDDSDYVTNCLWKNRKKSRIVLTKQFVSSRGNRYVGILIYTQQSSKGKDWSRSSFHIGLMPTFKGMAAIAFYEKSGKALKFTAHFFKRYKQRLLQVCDWKVRNQLMQASSIEELIPIYIKRNIGIAWIETESVFRDKVHIFAPVNDGVVLIQWDKTRKLLQANTFVTMDMLDEKQKTMVGYAKTYFAMTPEEQARYKFPDFVSDDDESNDNKKQKQ